MVQRDLSFLIVTGQQCCFRSLIEKEEKNIEKTRQHPEIQMLSCFIHLRTKPQGDLLGQSDGDQYL